MDAKTREAAAAAGCPVAHDGGGRGAAVSSRPSPMATPPTATSAAAPPPQALVCDSASLSAAGAGAGAGVGGGGGAAAVSAAAASSSAAGSAPSAVNDVFGDAQPIAGQRFKLSTAAVKSTIPKGGVEDPNAVWEFPSLQRFYNAMSRKGWNPSETDMAATVSVHNTVNEKCWAEVLKYEAFHKTECACPKLLRFKGRPAQFSPKARLLHAMGYVLPFDRHDWTVDRCGKPVRYVIDFYVGARDTALAPNPHPNANANANANLNVSAAAGPVAGAAAPAAGGGSVPLAVSSPIAPAIHLDVRPAVSFEGVIDRVRMAWKKAFSSE